MAMDPCDASPLLLLLLLRVLLLGLLVFLEKAGPFFVRGKLFVGRQHRIGRGHPDAHLQLGFSGSFHGAYSRGYVGVIAPDRRSNVSAAHNQVVGRVETPPADMRKKRLDPCMRGALVGAIRVLGIAMQVAAHIAAWNSEIRHDRDHGMRTILTNALPG